MGSSSVVGRLLMEERLKIDFETEKGDTALHLMAKYCPIAESDVVTVIIKRGVDVNAVNQEGNTALHISCTEGFANMTDILLQHGANFSILNNRVSISGL